METFLSPDRLASSLNRMFRPASVAIVGASPQRGGPRNRVVRNLLKHDFPGRVFPVSPSHAEIEGLQAYKSIGECPEVPDVALVITPAATVPGIIDECGRKGVSSAIVFSAGFEETESGREIARELVAAARRHDVAILGPNGQGLWSVAARTFLTFSPAALSLETVRHAPVAVISQSGALGGAIAQNLQVAGLGSSYIVSVGNESCLDALDVLSWVIEQEDVRVVGLYLEGLDKAGRLLTLAARARARGVQLVILKSGRSVFGQEATASHTGKIASPHVIYQDVLAQAGVIVAESLGEILAALTTLAVLPRPRVSRAGAGGVAILSSSGGAGALLADHGEERGLPMAEFGPDTLGRLDDMLPDFARKKNPIDLTGQIRSDPDLFRKSVGAVAADPNTEALVIQFTASGSSDLRDNADAFAHAARGEGLPVVISFAGEVASGEVAGKYLEMGLLLSDEPANTMRALKWVYERERMAHLPGPPARPALARRAAPVSWEDTMSFLTQAGVPPAEWRILEPGQTAARICADLPRPFVVKALPSEADHKTELGLVKLRVQTFDEVDAHCAAFRRIVGKPDMKILVQTMITDGVEVVLSCLRDTDFGPVLSIGSGGVAIELYRDITYVALPTTPELVGAALRRLKLWTMLQGFRGAPEADIDALVDAAVRFGDAMVATPDLAEAEINPVLVRPKGLGLAAVDFLGRVAPRPDPR